MRDGYVRGPKQEAEQEAEQETEQQRAGRLANAAHFMLSGFRRRQNVKSPEGAQERDTILIVDDCELQRAVLAAQIKQTTTGFKIEEAASAEKAIKIISEGLADRLILVLSDHNLPGKSGLDLARALREEASEPEEDGKPKIDVNKTRDIPFIILSGSANSPTEPVPAIQAAINDGHVDGFAKKPFPDRGIRFYSTIAKAVKRAVSALK